LRLSDSREISQLLGTVRYKNKYGRAIWPAFWLTFKGLAAVFDLSKGLVMADADAIDNGVARIEDIAEYFRAKCKFDIIGALTNYQKNIDKGHALSRGTANSKSQAIKYFTKASEIADEISRKVNIQGKWIVAPLRSEALTYLASVEFYDEDYVSAMDHYKYSENLFDEVAKEGGLIEGEINEKTVNIRGRMLTAHLTYLNSNRVDPIQIHNEIQQEYSDLALRIRDSILNGKPHDQTYCRSVLKWSKQKIDDNEFSLSGETMSSFDIELLRADRREVLKNCSVFLANYAWSKLYFGSNIADSNYLESADYYEACLNTVVSAIGVKQYSDYRYYDSIFDDAYLNGDYYNKEIQISVGRNLIYQLAALKSIGLTERYNRSLNRLRSVVAKDKSKYPHHYLPVVGTVDTAKSNLKRIGLGEQWARISGDVEKIINLTIESS